MANEHRNLVISSLLLGLFMVLTITIVYQMGVNHEVSPEKMDQATQGVFDMDDYEAEIEESQETSSNFRERFEGGDIDDVDDPAGLFTILGDLVSMITTPFKLMFQILTTVLHVPSIVSTTLVSIVTILIIFSVWAVIRKGD